MMDGKVIVFLRTSSVARAPVYRHLRSLGAVLVLVDPFTPMPDFDGLFEHWLQVETADVNIVRVALRDFLAARHLSADAILSFDEYAVFQAATLAVDFQLTPVPLPPAAIQQNNLKDQFRLFCAAHGIHSPRSARLPLSQLPSAAQMSIDAGADGALDRAFAELHAGLQASIVATLRAARVEFPVVLKPSPGAGSLLARLCHSAEEATRHVWCMWRTLANHPDTKHFVALANAAPAVCESSVHILAEEYIGGQEVDMDCVIERGVVQFCAISDNFAPSPPFFAEVGGLCPSALGLEEQAALRDLLASYVSACGEQLNGVLHFEAKYDHHRRRAYVIEVNCRPGSAETNTMLTTVYREMSLGESVVRCALHLPIREQLARLYPELMSCTRARAQTHNCLCETDTVASALSHDTSVVKHAAAVSADVPLWRALGGPSRGFFPPQCWAASVNIYPTCAGTLKKVKVATEDASLVAFSVSAKPGEAVAPPPTRFYLLSWMVARGKSAEEATDNIHRLTASFVQEIEPQKDE